jgi:hypothetical protein
MTFLVSIAVVGTLVAVVAALFSVLWRERNSEQAARVALVSGIALAAWALAGTVLAYYGFFHQADQTAFPPIGIALIIASFSLGVSLAGSSTLRGLLTRQSSLIRLNAWRLIGVVFIVLMLAGKMPALWALPAGIGDILVGATAFRVAHDVASARGRRRAIIWNLFGMADLIVAVAVGVMTVPGPAQIFQTTPTSELVTYFPLALVPVVLVPLAFAIHVASLWQLLGGTWAGQASVTLIEFSEEPLSKS